MRKLAVLLPLLAAGCGATAKHASPPQFTVHRYGTGVNRVWVYSPAKPRLIVLFVHGLGDSAEATPVHHREWLEHMARRGYQVVYPAFETYPGEPGAMKHLLNAVELAEPHLTSGLPVAAIGYSRGGRLVADYASISSVTGLVPGRILSVFPAGTMDTPLDLAPLSGHTKVLILAGDADRVVANVGANELITQLASSGFPYADVSFEVVRSHGFFVADHLSVLDDSPAAQRAFWTRADRFFAPLLG